MDYNYPASSVHEILQARIQKWAAISFLPSCNQKAKQLWDKTSAESQKSWGRELGAWPIISAQCVLTEQQPGFCWVGEEPSFESAPKGLWGIGQWGLEGLLYFPYIV